MPSLSKHLERHDLAAGPLAFRRDCPRCRAERVHGTLPRADLVPSRACAAALSVAVAAAGAVAPGAMAAGDGQGLAAPAPAVPAPPELSDIVVDDGGAAPVGGDRGAGQGSASAGRHETNDRSVDAAPTPESSPSADSVRPTEAGHSDSGGSRQRRGGAAPDTGAARTAPPAGDEGAASDGPPAAPTGAPARTADPGPASAPPPTPDDAPVAAVPPVEPGATPAPSRPGSSPAPAGGAAMRRRPSTGPAQPPTSNAERGSRAVPDGPPRGKRRASPGPVGDRAPSRGGRRADRSPGAHEAAAGPRSPARHPRVEPEPAAAYRVRPGDSLWRIAARHLGPDVSAGAIAQEVTRLWELNRERLRTGDPDLIYPGQTLRMR